MTQLPQIKMKGTLADRTYDTLKQAIINLELAPGQIITEESLTEQLGVSRTPIRSAMNRLCQEGLVTISQGKGSFVTELGAREVKHLFEVRLALERLAVRTAMEAAAEEPKLLAELRGLLNQQAGTFQGEGRDPRRYMLSDISFHMSIAGVGGNPYLQRELQLILDGCSRYSIAFLGELLTHSDTVYLSHCGILECMENGDEEQAQERLSAHILEIERDILISLDQRRGKRKE